MRRKGPGKKRFEEANWGVSKGGGQGGGAMANGERISNGRKRQTVGGEWLILERMANGD